MWLEAYEDDNFIAKVDAAWAEIEPLYAELHTYVRRKLKEKYGDKMDDSDNLIPGLICWQILWFQNIFFCIFTYIFTAHILGNMWYD